MNSHVSFEQMCDFVDQEITAERERARIQAHVDSCAECGRELARLRQTLCFCMELKKQKQGLGDLSPFVIRKLRARRGRHLMMKAVPAIAASLFIVLGIGLYWPRSLDTGRLAGAVRHSSAPLSDSEKVIGVLRQHEADILRVTNGYVEGRIPDYRFARLQSELGSRSVSYVLTQEPSSEVSLGSQWPSHMEEVGAGSAEQDRGRMDRASGSRYVVFRIYR